jgi:hypothetical protein
MRAATARSTQSGRRPMLRMALAYAGVCSSPGTRFGSNARISAASGSFATCGRKKSKIELKPVSLSPGIARTFVEHFLLTNGFKELVDDGYLIASELVTNAHRGRPGKRGLAAPQTQFREPRS